MTLYFIGHNFRYECEAVMKLFFPARSFEFALEDTPAENSGDSALLSRKVYSGMADLRAVCRVGGKTSERSEKIPLNVKDYEHACELTLCRLMFLCLKEITGISPAWGVLTGVRPVKLVTGLLKSGLSEDEIYSKMSEYYVTKEKTALCLETAKNQESCLKGLDLMSASLYVSIPFCPSRCAYCSFVSQTVESFKKLIPEYVGRLCDEIRFIGEKFSESGLKLDAVYFGGGTPTAIPADDLDKIMRTVSSEFDLSHLREYTVEAGRPDTIDEEKLNVILSNGGRRISVNPQTLQNGVLEKIGRRHTAEDFLRAYEIAEKAGFDSINVDLIAGLPGDDLRGFCKTLEKIISLGPGNITVHTLSIKRAADMMHSDGFEVSPDETAKMVEHTNSSLMAAGYRPYYLYRQKNQLSNLENVGWAKDGKEGIYNINMMEEVQTVIAAGAGGSTKIVAGPGRISRLYNPKYPLEYIKRFDETVIKRKAEAFERINEAVGNGALNRV